MSVRHDAILFPKFFTTNKTVDLPSPHSLGPHVSQRLDLDIQGLLSLRTDQAALCCICVRDVEKYILHILKTESTVTGKY
jgi:hypothetical protein